MKLILINGAPGVGKSTLSRELAKEFPLCLTIEIDTWRSFIQEYREHRQQSLDLATKYALAAVEIQLTEGFDVIIDKSILGANEVIDTFRSLGKKYGAEIYEFILFAEKDVVLKRADSRGYREGGLLTPERAAERWEVSKQLSEERKEAIVIDTTNLTAEEVFEEVKRNISNV